MANPKAATVRDMPDDTLLQELKDNKDELFKLRFQHITGQLDNYSRLNELRRQIARINTELRAREIAAAEAMES